LNRSACLLVCLSHVLAGVDTLETVLAILLYPGLGLAIGLALLFGWLTQGRAFFGQVRVVAFWKSLDGLAGMASIVFATVALTLLPWPLHLAGHLWGGRPLVLWAAIEGAFLAPVLPALLAPSPLAARAASREAQLGVAGRFVIWIALGTALWAGADWSWAALPGRALIGLAGLLALPLAIGAGPFEAERSMSAAGAEEGLDVATAGLVRFARTFRSAVLLAVLIVASLPSVEPWGAATQIRPVFALLIGAAVFVVVALLLRQLAAALPRLTLPAALHWCWWRALPLAIAGLVYLII
jgi:hypothetical protein